MVARTIARFLRRDDATDQRDVDLDFERPHLEVRKGGRAVAEVVESDANAQLSQPAQDAQGTVEVGQNGAFGNFQRQAFGRELPAFELGGNELGSRAGPSPAGAVASWCNAATMSTCRPTRGTKCTPPGGSMRLGPASTCSPFGPTATGSCMTCWRTRRKHATWRARADPVLLGQMTGRLEALANCRGAACRRLEDAPLAGP